MKIETERDGYLLFPETEAEADRLIQFLKDVATDLVVVVEASQLPLSSGLEVELSAGTT